MATKIDGYVGLVGQGLGLNAVIKTNVTTVNENLTVPAGVNGFSVGPITIAGDKTVTVEDGARWVIL